MNVKKAMIPAAGLGTRFLPATKAIPKEMIPVVDRPGIQYSIEECARSGIDDVLFITGWGKSSMVDHFDRALELEARLEQTGKLEELESIRRIANLVRVYSVRQKEALGLGHAVLQGRNHIGRNPFAVLLPDEIVPEPRDAERDLLAHMIEVFEERNASGVVAVTEEPPEDISGYGVASVQGMSDDVARMVDFVEKPAPEDAPSNLGARGRYVLSPDIFDLLERTPPGHGGEIQLTDAIRTLAREGDVYVVISRTPLFDVGKKLDYVKATVEMALRRDEYAKPLAEFLREVASRLE